MHRAVVSVSSTLAETETMAASLGNPEAPSIRLQFPGLHTSPPRARGFGAVWATFSGLLFRPLSPHRGQAAIHWLNENGKLSQDAAHVCLSVCPMGVGLE